ncbi:MAG: BamA/TamA family outer membrane protein, partial [Gemmatimonadaceae bacterium]
LTLGLGATARHATTGPDSGRFIAATRPFGVGSFGQIGARARLTFDSRDTPAFATRGIFATLQGAQYPGIWSAEGPFGAVRAQAATYLSAPLRLRPVLALRVGGDRVWGEYPFFDAAFLGGASTLRGWREERFAGDASLYGNAELRVVLAKVSLLLPADLGAFGLADGGRVFISEERSDAWHTAFGGGLWVSFLGRANTFSIAAARGREGTGIYFRTGMLF